MRKTGLLLRWLSIVSWFTPFVFCMSTCVGNEYRTAYSKEEARKNISEAHVNTIKNMQADIDSFRYSANKNSQGLDTLKKRIYEALMRDWPDHERIATDTEVSVLDKVVFPSSYCLSGFGTLFEFKNALGQILNAICLFFALLILILWKFFRRKKITLWMLIFQVLFTLAFLINGLIAGVDFLWGFWIYLLLNFLQVYIEYAEKKRLPVNPVP